MENLKAIIKNPFYSTPDKLLKINNTNREHLKKLENKIDEIGFMVGMIIRGLDALIETNLKELQETEH